MLKLPLLCAAACAAHPWAQFGRSPTLSFASPYVGPSAVPITLWQAPTNGTLYSSAAVSDAGVVFVGTRSVCMHALRLDTGSSVWLRCLQPGGDMLASPALSADGGTLYAAARNGEVFALSTADGATTWTFQHSAPVDGSLCEERVLGPRAHPTPAAHTPSLP